jgi:hypothetical protein
MIDLEVLTESLDEALDVLRGFAYRIEDHYDEGYGTSIIELDVGEEEALEIVRILMERAGIEAKIA